MYIRMFATSALVSLVSMNGTGFAAPMAPMPPNMPTAPQARTVEEPAGNEGASSRPEPTTLVSEDGNSVSIARASSSGTTALVNSINAASSVCSQIGSEYFVDCMGERLDRLAAQMPSHGDYAEAQQILENAAAKLRTLARRHQDIAAPRVRLKLQENGKSKLARPIVATKASSRAAVRQEASAILQEAETQLLRSAANSVKRRSHYEQIAQAVGSSNKVLLRSL